MKEVTGDYLDVCMLELQKYYMDKGLTIIGLNDSQGVNTTTTFFKKGLLEYLAASLTCEKLNPTVINAFSLLMNKTEHIDYFLENNLSLEEIKLSQVYSVVSALEKVMKDVGLPQELGKIGYLYKLIYQVKEGDKDIKLASQLKKSEEPTLIYSSGVNDLMRAIHNNPFGIKKDYKNREKEPNFNYTLEKSKDPKVLKQVIDSIERNLENILKINYKTDIYTLGAYVPASLQVQEMNIFKELIIKYNEALENLCKAYQITFIDTENVGNSYNNSQINFHVSTKGHNALANYILIKMHENKILALNNKEKLSSDIFEISNKGITGIVDATYNDYQKSLNTAKNLSGYEKEVELKNADEHLRETKVFQKILKRN